MSKPVIRLGFADYFETLDSFFIDTLSNIFEIERDDENPQFLIFCDETFGNSNAKFNDKNVVKIFFTGENRRPYNYHCHFAMTFDHDSNPRHYRLPLYVVDNYVNSKIIGLPDIREVERTSTVKEKTGFCSFVVRNGGCQERNNMFHMLSQYKKVDSGGPLFNNIGYVLSREGVNGYHLAKRDFLKSRKFNLCYENTSYPGYVTEKIFHALTYNTIPIYWGSPTVEMDFNPKAFVSRHDFSSNEEMFQKILELDQDDDKYNEMLSQPIMNPRNNVFDLNRFNRWFHDVVYQGSMGLK